MPMCFPEVGNNQREAREQYTYCLKTASISTCFLNCSQLKIIVSHKHLGLSGNQRIQLLVKASVVSRIGVATAVLEATMKAFLKAITVFAVLWNMTLEKLETAGRHGE
jgi:hypothetical protein